MLIVVANNRSFFNDEIHQQHVAEHRGRPVENRWIGSEHRPTRHRSDCRRRAQSLQGFGPVESREQLLQALQSAVAAVRDGAAVVVDVRVDPTTYATQPPGFTGPERARPRGPGRSA